jgi:hypothetical protein
MAEDKKLNHEEESSPLLQQQQQQPKAEQQQTHQEVFHGWTADGLPMGHGSVMGQPIPRSQWNSSVFSCLGQSDHFCSSDLEVCKSHSVLGILDIHVIDLSFLIHILLIRFINFIFICIDNSVRQFWCVLKLGVLMRILGFNFSYTRIHHFVRRIIKKIMYFCELESAAKRLDMSCLLG